MNHKTSCHTYTHYLCLLTISRCRKLHAFCRILSIYHWNMHCSVIAEFIQEMTSRNPRQQPISVVAVRHVSGTCWSASGAVWRPPSVGVGWPPRRCVWSSWFEVVGWRATCAAGRRSGRTVPPTLPPRRRRRTDDHDGHHTTLGGSTRRVQAAALNDLHNCINSNHVISVTKSSKYTVSQKKSHIVCHRPIF